MGYWNTEQLAAKDQFPFWREVLCQAYTALDPIAAHSNTFKGNVTAHLVSDLNVTVIRSERQQIFREPAQIRRDPSSVFFLNLQIGGKCRMVQDSRETVIRPGEFSLVDSTKPYLVDYCSDEWEQYSIRIPRDALLPLLKAPNGATATRVSERNGGMAAVAVDFIKSLTRNASSIGDCSGNTTMQASLIDLVALALGATDTAKEGGRQTTRQALCNSIVNHIDANLSDPDISPSQVAQHFGISTRYLHKTLEESDKSFGRLLLERRLDACASELVHKPDEAISSVGMRLGFNDLSHFSRTFRQRFGMSPRQYRQEER